MGGDIFSGLGSRCVIVTGKSSAAVSGALNDVLSALFEAGIEYKHLGDVRPNPLLSDAFKYGRSAREFDAQFVIGIGGGSPMDTAKAVALYAANDIEMMEIYEPKKYKNPPLPIVCIPTTAGTGSEVTQYAVMSLQSPDVKQSIRSRELFPRFALVDPSYTDRLPLDITISTAFDALAHAVESCLMQAAGPFSRLYSERAVSLLWPSILSAERGSLLPIQRDRLMQGAVLGGMAIAQTGTAFPHPSGYPLTVRHGLPHGLACAHFMPDMLRHYSLQEAATVNRLLDLMEVGSIDDFERIIRRLAPIEITLSREQAREYAQEAAKSPTCSRMLVPIDVARLEEIFTRLFVKQ